MADDTIHDEILGELKQYDRFSYGKRVRLGQQEVRVIIDIDDQTPHEGIGHARRILSDLAERAPRAARFACEAGLLDLKNEVWLQGEEDPLTAEEFTRRLSLYAVEIDSDGCATLYFADDGIFAGHSISVYLDADGELWDTKLAG